MAIKSFKFFWTAHKWTGIISALLFVIIACTGFMLLIKKRSDWIQPPTQIGAPGVVAEFISVDAAVQAVLAQQHVDFQSVSDVDRIDVRVEDRVYKITSRHNYTEIQVCAVTGNVLSTSWRPSDLFEDIHDGSFFGGWVHDWIMPIVPAALLFLVCSGIWLWIEPIVRRRRRLKRQYTSQQLETAP